MLLRCAVAVYLTIRVSALGFTWVLPLVGAASTGVSSSVTPALLLVALSFHVFAYVLNDVVDYWVDRHEPLRSDSPLVHGRVSRRCLLVLAWVQPPLAFPLALLGGASGAALTALLGAFIAMTVYDVYGKRCAWPLLTDAVQAAGWCALVLAGAWWQGLTTPPLTVWLIAYVFFCVLLVQGVHGGLRDLANDARSGARTTAQWLGARAGEGGGIALSRAMAVYVVLLQAAMGATALAALSSVPVDAAAGGAARALTLAALFGAAAALARAYACRGDKRRFIANGAWNIICSLLVLPALVLPGLDGGMTATLLAALLLPITAMLVYNGTHWRVPPPAEAEQ
jgi:4-hydroxybenzoate polyprenyltransferase